MRHFLKLAEKINVNPLLLAIARQPELWNAIPIRTKTEGTPHAQADDILLRFNDLSRWYEAQNAELDMASVAGTIIDAEESKWFPAIHNLPEARDLIFSLMAAVRGERLGRVIVTRLKPGALIPSHVDGGGSAVYYDRFQIALQSLPGALFRIEDETVQFNTGETWWINNSLEHEVLNNSKDDRLVLIVDIRRERFQ
jgi:hypothetical protein